MRRSQHPFNKRRLSSEFSISIFVIFHHIQAHSWPASWCWWRGHLRVPGENRHLTPSHGRMFHMPRRSWNQAVVACIARGCQWKHPSPLGHQGRPQDTAHKNKMYILYSLYRYIPNFQCNQTCSISVEWQAWLHLSQNTVSLRFRSWAPKPHLGDNAGHLTVVARPYATIVLVLCWGWIVDFPKHFFKFQITHMCNRIFISCNHIWL